MQPRLHYTWQSENHRHASLHSLLLLWPWNHKTENLLCQGWQFSWSCKNMYLRTLSLSGVWNVNLVLTVYTDEREMKFSDWVGSFIHFTVCLCSTLSRKYWSVLLYMFFYVNNIFIFCMSTLWSFDFIYRAMLCMVHWESAHRVLYVPDFNVSL